VRRGAYTQGYEGANTIDTLLDQGAVVKQLGGDHKELYTQINENEGTTFDQQMFTKLVREKLVNQALEPGGVLQGATDDQINGYTNLIDPQVFVIDAWRLREYASVFADHLTRTNPHDRGDIEQRRQTVEYKTAYDTALYAGWAFNFSTAATLTDGSQPVYMAA
jgi:hypothetical protein